MGPPCVRPDHTDEAIKTLYLPRGNSAIQLGSLRHEPTQKLVFSSDKHIY